MAQLDLSRRVFVVEGILDYVTLWQWDHQAVPTLGTSIKKQAAHRLAQVAKVIFVPDSDKAGEAATVRWREAVEQGVMLCVPESA